MSLFLNRNVEYFLKIVSVGSFSEAAQLLGLSQPALSISIKNFEAEIGCALFLRQGKNAALTAKGQELFTSLSLLRDRIRQEVDPLLATQTIVHLRVGSIPWFAQQRLMPFVASRKSGSNFKHCQYFFRPAGFLVEAVERGWIDFAFVNWPEKPKKVESIAIESDPAVIAGLKTKFAHIEKAKSYRDLENEPWLYREARRGNWTESIPWGQTGFVMTDVFMLRYLILEGHGIYEFQTAYFTKSEVARLAIAKFPSRYANNWIFAIWRPGLSKEKKDVLDQVLTHLQSVAH